MNLYTVIGEMGVDYVCEFLFNPISRIDIVILKSIEIKKIRCISDVPILVYNLSWDDKVLDLLYIRQLDL